MEMTLNSNFMEMQNEEMTNIDGGLAITVGGIIVVGLFTLGTAAGLIWG